MEFKIKRYCTVCGRIHAGHCRPIYDTAPRNSQADKFRNTQLWKRTAAEIKERDMQCCRMCLARGVLVNRGLSVHHIVPIAEDYDLRLEPSNLITLCRYCHEKAERGLIPRAMLIDIVNAPVIDSQVYPPGHRRGVFQAD